MSSIRRLLDELVERRLWPIALALAIALVAIPVVVGTGSDSPDARELGVIDADPAPLAKATPAVVLVGPPEVRARPGKLRDPFRRAKVKKAKESSSSSSSSSKTSSSSTSAGSGSSSSKSSGSSSSSGGGTSTTTTPPAAPPPPHAPTILASRSVYVAAASFTGPGLDYEHPLRRLAVFGNPDNPALLYMGVSRGGEYAIFLLGPKATASGDDGACIVADSCRAIGLRIGDTLDVRVAEGDGSSSHYVLKLTSLRKLERRSPAVARRDRGNVAEGGREALRALLEDGPTAGALKQLRYVPASGTVALVRSP